MNERQTEVTLSYYLPENTDDPNPDEERTYSVITDNAGIVAIIEAMDGVSDQGSDE